MNAIRSLSAAMLPCALLFLIACSGETPPATRAEVTVPTSLPSITPLPEPTATWTPPPTTTPTTTSRPEPTATQPAPGEPEGSPTASSTPPAVIPTVSSTPTEPAGVVLTIEQPAGSVEVVAGEELIISGLAEPAREAELLLAIDVASRNVASGSTTVDPDTGRWQATLAVSRHVTGPARLIVSPESSDETAELDLEILPDEGADNPGLTLKRPGEHDTAVAGYSLFFGGRARNPIDNTIIISVMVDDCTTVATSQSFTLVGGAWHGLLILPPDVTGPACAVATTGTVGEGEWREARLPITILTSDNEEAYSLTLGSPSDSHTFRAGQAAQIFGVAINAPDDRVHVVVNLDDTDGTLLAEGTAEVDNFGYWALQLPLPQDVTGPAIITASMGEGNNHIEFRTSTTITE